MTSIVISDNAWGKLCSFAYNTLDWELEESIKEKRARQDEQGIEVKIEEEEESNHSLPTIPPAKTFRRQATSKKSDNIDRVKNPFFTKHSANSPTSSQLLLTQCISPPPSPPDSTLSDRSIKFKLPNRTLVPNKDLHGEDQAFACADSQTDSALYDESTDSEYKSTITQHNSPRRPSFTDEREKDARVVIKNLKKKSPDGCIIRYLSPLNRPKITDGENEDSITIVEDEEEESKERALNASLKRTVSVKKENSDNQSKRTCTRKGKGDEWGDAIDDDLFRRLVYSAKDY